MSIKRRFNFLGQMRVDLPHLKMVEDSILFDWKNLWQTFVADTPYILNGFTIATPWSSGNPANSLQVIVANSNVVVPGDAAGSFLVVPSGTPNEQLSSANNRVTGSFTPSTTNFVSIQFSRNADNATADLVAFWDQDAQTEFTKTVPLGLVLNYQFVINTTGFGTNAPICKVDTDAFNNIVQITNCKQGMLRLGSGGSTPDPNNEWNYTVNPENALSASSSSSDPFAGGDWEIKTLKNWMDAVMTEIKGMKGSAYWYSPGSSLTPGVNLSDMFFDSASSVLTGSGTFASSLVTTGSLSWSSDIYLRGIIGPLYFRILQTSSPATLTDLQVAYVLLQRNIILQSSANFAFTNGSPTVTCSVAITDPLIVAGNWIKANGHGSQYWALIQSVLGSTVTLTSNYLGPTAIDKAVGAVRDYNMQVANPESVVNSGDTYWLAKRDDHAPASVSITSATRTSNIVTIVTSAPHNLVAGMMVQIIGVTDTSFNGVFEIKDVPGGSSLRYDQTGVDASSSGGTVSKGAVIYLRGLAELDQGEIRFIDDNTTHNIIEYIGSQAESDSTPIYSTTLGSFSANNFVVDTENLTKGIKRVDIAVGGAIANANQDRNLKLVLGGTWSWNAGTNTLSWDDDAYIQIPDLTDERNTILAGSVVLPLHDDVAYVEINRTAGGPTNLTVSVSNIDALAPTNNTVIFARKFGSSSIVAQQTVNNAGDALDNAATQAIANPFTVAAPTTITDIEFRMARTGSPSGNITVGIQGDSAGDPDGVYIVSTTFLASSVAAFPGESVFHITTPTPVAAGTFHLVATSDATYKATTNVFNNVSIKRDSVTVTPPLEEYYNGAVWADQASGALYFIIQQASFNEVVVGSHSFRLVDGESKELDAGMSIENRTAIGLADEAQDSPAWQGDHGSPLRTIGSDSQSVFAAGASIDTEIDKFFGQLRLKAAGTPSTRVIVTNPDVTMLTGEKRSQQVASLLLEMDGAQIDFQTGTIYEADGMTTRGINFTPVVPATGMYRWFSVGLVAGTANANNTLDGQILIIAASADGASPSLAPRAAFSDSAISLGQVVITSPNGTTVTAIPQGNIVQMGVGGANPGTGSGSGIGDDLNALTFLASFTDDFNSIPDAAAPVDISAGKTDANAYSVVNKLYRLNYDASKTVTGTGTSMTLSATPSFTVKVGDILVVGNEARRITVVTSQVLYTIEAAFTVDPSAAAATVSQVVYTKDLNNFAGDGLAPSAVLVDDLNETLVFYQDSLTLNDAVPDYGIAPHVAYTASADGTSFTFVNSRVVDPTTETSITDLPTSDSSLYVRFFANKSSGSGAVNLLGYKLFFHRETAQEGGSIVKQASGRTDGLGTLINSSVSVVGGKTRITFSGDFVYSVGINPGKLNGQLKVFLNGQKLPRFLNATSTPNAYYTEIDAATIELDTDYSAFSIEYEAYIDVSVIDASDQNSTSLALLMPQQQSNLVYNPEGLVFQRTDPSTPTAVNDDVFGPDRWNILCSANDVSISRDTDTIPEARYAMKLTKTTSSGFFGMEQMFEASESIPLRNKDVVFSLWAKTTSSEISQIRISILGWTSTADSITSDVISSWAGSPTYIANIVEYGTTTLNLTNSYQEVAVTANIGSTCNNLIIIVHTTNSESTNDDMWLTGARLSLGTVPLQYFRRHNSEEINMCQKYYEKTYDTDTPPGTVTFNGAFQGQQFNVYLYGWSFKESKRVVPTCTVWSPGTGASGVIRNVSTAADVAATLSNTGINVLGSISTGAGNNNNTLSWHLTADAEL